MKISARKLSAAIEKSGVLPEQLAQNIAEGSLRVDDAARAIRNWSRGVDHPRCKASHVARMAAALGVEPKDLVVFTSRVYSHRGSPRKASLLTELIRGKSADQALNLLAFSPKRAALNVRKALLAAIADAQMADASESALYVCESRVDQGTRLKRFQPKDRGRAHPIIKPMAHITVSVEERKGK